MNKWRSRILTNQNESPQHEQHQNKPHPPRTRQITWNDIISTPQLQIKTEPLQILDRAESYGLRTYRKPIRRNNASSQIIEVKTDFKFDPYSYKSSRINNQNSIDLHKQRQKMKQSKPDPKIIEKLIQQSQQDRERSKNGYIVDIQMTNQIQQSKVYERPILYKLNLYSFYDDYVKGPTIILDSPKGGRQSEIYAFGRFSGNPSPINPSPVGPSPISFNYGHTWAQFIKDSTKESISIQDSQNRQSNNNSCIDRRKTRKYTKLGSIKQNELLKQS